MPVIKKRLGLSVLMLALTSAACCIILLNGKTPAQTLVIKDAVSGKMKGRWVLNDGDEFAIEFIHSVNQSPVRETFKAEGGRIRAVSVRFHSFGAGMQSSLEEGQTMSRDGDAMIINGLNRSFAELNYIVGTVSDHVLIINAKTISLTALCGKNAHITLRIR